MAERASQLGFEFAQEAIPSVASVELAATRARKLSSNERAEPRRSAAVQASPRESLPLPEDRETAQPWATIEEPELESGSAELGGSGPQLEVAHDAPLEQGAHILDLDLDITDASAPSSDDELARALELSLRARHRDPHTPLRLNVTDNFRTMVSLRQDKARAQLEVRLHHMFLQAGPEIWSALGEYLFSGDREAARSIARYIEQHRQRIRRPERRPLTLKAAGRHHDLQAIYQAVNQRYFDGTVSVNVTWARKQAARASADRRSIKLGSYTSRDRLIRVHPALDAAFVPRYFIEYIVYHEMLHHVLPPKQHDRRRELHGPEFLARERQFHDYRVALQWERENLAKLLRRRVTRRPSVER